jgi:putative phosphoribosyl transferase
MFRDRKDAGRKLAEALEAYRGQKVLVLAIPRGGVEIGCEVAAALRADFSLLICRKLPFPDNSESGFGALAEDGSLFINEAAAASVSDAERERIVEEQREEVRRRIESLRGGEPLPPVKGRTVILVDDGIAMGSTMYVAVELCRKRGAGKIVVAAPVAGEQSIRKFSKMADEVVVLESPEFFYAVAQVYEAWRDVGDAEALERFRRCSTPT